MFNKFAMETQRVYYQIMTKLSLDEKKKKRKTAVPF